MFDELTQKERYGLAGAAVLLLAVGFGAGVFTSGGTPTGNVAASGDTATVRQAVQDFMNQQLQRQQQQLQQVATQSPNISADDLSMDATVSSVEPSQFGSLYKATVSVSGTVPSRRGGLRDVSQETTFYLTGDGRYLFQAPTDLQQPQQPAQRQQPPTSPQQ
ncbi:MAG: hypothetical protein SVU32_04160 [Candidatus Nanohaloarchaea archaeon]|nr:hypothetical protein [Candidatus Nanohaloarchaea archaeon]